MAGNNKDVNLVIRAKNEASKAILDITSAIENLNRSQRDFGRQAGKTDSLLSQLTTEFETLTRTVGGKDSFERVKSSLDQATTSVKRMEEAVSETTAEQARLGTEIEKASQAHRELQQQANAATNALDAEKRKLKELQDQAVALRKSLKGGPTGDAAKQIAEAENIVAAEKAKLALIRQQQTDTGAKTRDNPAIERQRVEVEAAQEVLRVTREAVRQEIIARKEAAAQAIAAQKSVVQAAAETARQKVDAEKSASAKLTDLTRASDSAASSLQRQSNALQKARSELTTIAEAAQKADAAMSKLETTSRGRMLQSLAQQRATLAELKAQWEQAQQSVAAQGGAAKVGPNLPGVTAAIQAAQTAKQAYLEQRESVASLGRALKSAQGDFSLLTAAQKQFADQQTVTADRVKAVKAAVESAAQAARSYGGSQSQGSARPVPTTPAVGPRATPAPAPVSPAATIDDEVRGRRNILELLGMEQRESRQSMSVYQRLRGEVLALIAAYAGFQGVVNLLKSVVDASGQLNSMTIKMNVAAGSKQGGAQELRWVRSEADRLGLVMQSLGDQWGKFSLATKNSNISLAESRKIFTNMSEAFRAMNLGEEDAKGAFVALTQMVSKGSIQAEELRQQLGERLPGAFSLMARAAGVSEEKLMKMMETGQLSSRYLIDFSELVKNEYASELPAALEQTQAHISKLKNTWFDILTTMGKSGLIDAINDALKKLNAYLKSDEGIRFAKDFGASMASVVRALSAATDHSRVFFVALSAFVGLKVGVWAANAVAALAEFRAALIASTVAAQGTTGAMRGLSVAMALLRGPAGIVIGATAVAAAIGTWATRTDEASTAAESHARIIEDIRAAYAKVGGELDKISEKQKIIWARDSELSRQSNQTVVDRYINDLRKPYLAERRSIGTMLSTEMPGVDGYTQEQLDTRAAFDNREKFFQQIDVLVDKVKAGKISIEEFQNEIKLVDYAAKDSLITKYAKSLEAVSPEAIRAQNALKSLDAVIESMRTGNSQAMESQLDLNDGLAGVAKGAGNAATKLEQYNEALANLRQYIPAQDFAFNFDQKVEKAQGFLTSAVSQVSSISSAKELNATLQNDFIKPLKAAGNNTQQVELIIGLAAEKLGGDTDKVLAALRRFADALSSLSSEMGQKQLSAMGLKTDSYFARLRFIEDGGNPLAKNPRSSAFGIGQFTNGTWLEQFDRVFPELASWAEETKLAMRSNAEMAQKILENFTRENAVSLARAGFEPTNRNLYMAHFLGAQGAINTLKSGPQTPLANVLSADAIKANPEMLGNGRTVGDLLRTVDQKMGVGGGAIQSNGATAQEDLNAKVQQRVESLKAEAQARQESTREMEIQQELNRWAADAAKDGLKLTAEQEAAIRKVVGAKWDEVHAEDALKAKRKEAKQAEEEVVGLYQLRKQILENIELAYSVGNPMEADNLRKALEGVNVQLTEALPKAIALAESLNDYAAVAKLQNIKLQLSDVKGKILDAKQVNDLFASSAGSAFDGVAESIAGVIDGTKSWKEAMGGLRNAFLKFISDVLSGLAKMIIQQQIMAAIGSSGTGGGGLGGWISGLFSLGMAAFGGTPTIASAGAIGGGAAAVSHVSTAGLGGFNVYHSGGVVGASANRTRMAPTTWLANATRYHSGGIAGLQPNEVPAILQAGEEVLTKSDPRNILNGGAMPTAASQNPVNVKIVNTIDAAEMVSQGLNTAAGEKAILNMISANKDAVRAAMGN